VGGTARIRLTILHSNDIHGQVDGLARIATLVDRIRAETSHRVLYVDCGDVEETTSRLSNLTKGVAMHRLLGAAGCEVAAVGNAVWLRYGAEAVAAAARVASYPLLCANLKPIDGVADTALIHGVGFLAVTDPFERFQDEFDFGLRSLPVVEVAREHARALRAAGAELVVLLSHMGLDPVVEQNDDVLARELAGEVDLILGAHSHHALDRGLRVGPLLVAQAGSHAEWLGRVDVDGGDATATLLRVADDLPLHPAVVAEAERAERELDAHLDEVLAVLDEPLDPLWVAEMLRRRMDAEVGLAISGVALERTLPAGPLRRRDLWEACHTGANPGVADVPGSVLLRMLERGASSAFQEERPRPLRGRANGPLQVAGPADIDPARTYRVAGTDGELSASGGLLDESLPARYDFPTILREAIEEDLARTGERGSRSGSP
jgi:2',3'-cyclic-nucleotide 2'-phosphodiesterase (5'-nucleotidase family)